MKIVYNPAMRLVALAFAFVLSPWTQAAVVTSCEPAETAKSYILSATIPTYYKIWFTAGLDLKVGPVTQFEARDQNDRPVQDLTTSLTIKFDRVVPFYEEKRPLPTPRGKVASWELHKVFAVTAHFKSNTYDLDWRFTGDYQYLDKEMVRNLFCHSTEPIEAPAGVIKTEAVLEKI